MSTEREVLEILAAIIPTIGDTLTYQQYKGDMDINNGTLLQTEGIVQVSMVVDEGSNADEYTQQIRPRIPLRFQVYYRFPSDSKIEELAWDYQLVKADIKKDMLQAFWGPNAAGIPITCQIEELAYRSDDWLDGFDKGDKYGIALYFNFDVAYTMMEGE